MELSNWVPTLSLFDAGTEALKQVQNPMSRTSVRDAHRKGSMSTTIGGAKFDFTSGLPKCCLRPIHWSAMGKRLPGKFKLDYDDYLKKTSQTRIVPVTTRYFTLQPLIGGIFYRDNTRHTHNFQATAHS